MPPRESKRQKGASDAKKKDAKAAASDDEYQHAPSDDEEDEDEEDLDGESDDEDMITVRATEGTTQKKDAKEFNTRNVTDGRKASKS